MSGWEMGKDVILRMKAEKEGRGIEAEWIGGEAAKKEISRI